MPTKHVQSSPAFLLQKLPFGESDLILTFFTRDFGKVRGIAKGARASQKRFGGRLDFFHMCKLLFKPGKNDLAFIDSLELVEVAHNFGLSLETFTLGQYCLELTRELTEEDHPEIKIFDLLHATLRHFAQGVVETGVIARFFEINLIDLLGFRPTMDHCSGCGDAGQESWNFFSAARGGVICDGCRLHVRGQIFPINSDVLGFLGLALKIAQGRATIQELNPQGGADRNLQKILTACLEEHLRRPLQSLRVLSALT